MRHWEVGGSISIGWPDYNVSERPYTIVEFDRYGPVFRARVADAQSGGRQGGFLVVFGCPGVVLDMLAEQATRTFCYICWVGVHNRQTRQSHSLHDMRIKPLASDPNCRVAPLGSSHRRRISSCA